MPVETDDTISTAVNFDTDYDYKPLNKSFFQRVEEGLFRLMSGRFGKKKIPVKKEPAVSPEIKAPIPDQQTPRAPAYPRNYEIVNPPPSGYEVSNGNLFRKKNTAERVRDAFKFPNLKVANTIINGIALLVFAAGAYLLYSELPTRPELVIGILMVCVAGNVIIAKR